MVKYFLGCDWGTSSFRLQLFDEIENRVIGEIHTTDGIATMHQSWVAEGIQKGQSKAHFFRTYLQKQVEVLQSQKAFGLDNFTIVISGMASSSLGMEELPYGGLPFSVDGSNASIKSFTSEPDFLNPVILISGVQSENDVMRGEETQLIGLLVLLEQSGEELNDSVLIFPGTHSKHIRVVDGKMVNFKTFMTGEVFNIIGNHSILKNSIDKGDTAELSGQQLEAFRMGVQYAKNSPILHALFTVRTNELFQKLDKKENAFYLSGLLIGEELKYLVKQEEMKLALCCAPKLSAVYTSAIEELSLSSRTTIVPTDLAAKSALAGQQLIFKQHGLNR